MDPRDFLTNKTEGMRLYPYAKDVFYHPSGILSMTVEIYDDHETYEQAFGFNVHGKLKDFLDQIYEEQ
jgi:hypothetical protein